MDRERGRVTVSHLLVCGFAMGEIKMGEIKKGGSITVEEKGHEGGGETQGKQRKGKGTGMGTGF